MPLKKKESVFKKTAPKIEEKKKVPETEKDETARLSGLSKKRDSLIDEIKGNLMSNGALRRGGPANRSRYAQEQANYLPVIQEINDLGAQIKIRPIGLGHMRS